MSRASGTASIRGAARLAHPASAAHCLLNTKLASVAVFDLYRLDELAGTDPSAPPRAMAMEVILQRRVNSFRRRSLLSDSGTARGELQWHFRFDDLPPGNYHLLAFTAIEELEEGQQFEDPSRQAFGFSTHGQTQRWPWSVIRVREGQSVELECFPMHVAHSFAVLRRANSGGVRTQVTHGKLSLLQDSLIPVVRLGAPSAYERGFAHGELLAPYIVDFWRFYMLEYRFSGDIAKYETFVSQWVLPEDGHQFFTYPPGKEAEGVIAGAKASGTNLFMEELGRELDHRDILAGYIETRTVIKPGETTSAPSPQPQAFQTAAASALPASATAQQACSQVVVWGSLTAAGSSAPAGAGVEPAPVLAGRNMDGEIDIRKVTASHTVLFAIERESRSEAPDTFRIISCMWPGLIGTLTGVNETGLYICENAGETQPGTGLVAGLTPVASVQYQLLRELDARTFDIPFLKQVLRQKVSRTGWNSETRTRTTVEARTAELVERAVPKYATDSLSGDTASDPSPEGGFSGPGSIFVFALPPLPAAQPARKSAPVAAGTQSRIAPSPPRGFVLECDRTHTHFRFPRDAPPFYEDAILATNHAYGLGFDDQGVQSRELEAARAPLRAVDKCATLSPLYCGSGVHNRLTNWNVPVAASSLWRYEAARNRLQAWKRRGEKLDISHVKDLLCAACPGYTEHAFAVELHAGGRIRVHVAVASLQVGQWDAPYDRWLSFDFHDLYA